MSDMFCIAGDSEYDCGSCDGACVVESARLVHEWAEVLVPLMGWYRSWDDWLMESSCTGGTTTTLGIIIRK